MRVRALLLSSALLFILVGAGIPMVAPSGNKVPITMLVYTDGTVEFTSDFTTSDLGANPGVSSIRASLGITPTAGGGSKLELTAGVVFEGSTLEDLSNLFHKLNFGVLMYPNGTMALDLFLQLGPGGSYCGLSNWGYTQSFYCTEVRANARVVGETTNATLFLKLEPDTTYTLQEMIDYINQNSDFIAQQVQAKLGIFGFQITQLQLAASYFAANTALVRVDVSLRGNLTQIASQYISGTPTQVVFNPLDILGVFAAHPDDVSKLTLNFTDTGTLGAAIALNYKQNYDAVINANRLNYLSTIEDIARQDQTNGSPWLPLISLLKNSLLTASQTSFSFSANFGQSTMTWSARSPKMKVGEVSDNTVSLKQFLSSLGPLDEYTTDSNGEPGLTVTIRGVEDARAYMDIVIPSGVPATTSKNASSATWEGVYLDQLQDVSFTLRMKDTTPPTITSGIAQGATLSEKRPTLTATFSDNVGVDASTVVVKLDGVDVTSAATKSAAGVSYVPTSDLQDGLHTFYVKVQDTSGNPSDLTVNFTVSSGIPMTYLLGGGVVVIILLGAVAYFVFLRKPSAAVSGQVGPPPPPPPP